MRAKNNRTRIKTRIKILAGTSLLAVAAFACMLMVVTKSSAQSLVITAPLIIGGERETLTPHSIRAVALRVKSDNAVKQGQSFEDSTDTYKGSFAYNSLYKVIRSEIKQGRPTYALQLLTRDKMADKLKTVEQDRLRTFIAQSYMAENRLNRALDLAGAAARRSGHEIPEAGWIAGLASWRLNQFEKAQDYFTKAATAKGNSPWMVSAAGYWASRSAIRAKNFADVDVMLSIAAKYPRTFYGLIATRALGRDFDFDFDLPNLSSKAESRIEASPPAMEAMRVAKSGKITEALAHLTAGGWLSSREKREQILIYAAENKVPALALHLARSTKDKHGKFIDAALYPETPWQPTKGFKVDKALINALIRQESRFNPNATSSAGATGLMQLMPDTASFITKGEVADGLDNPRTNLNVGQNYVRHLLENDLVNNDLFKFAIAYNAGPGNLAKWQKELGNIKNDPLLFIESIPVAETRAFVERVMVNYWIYSLQNEREVKSLDAIASGYADHYQTAGQMHEVLALNTLNIIN